jgi:tRNA-dihydrouridine synthase C
MSFSSDPFSFQHPTLVFAPMEGVTDAPMREWMGKIAEFDYGVTEFIRVSESILTKKVFLRDVPEVKAGARTPSGLAVQVQLLGGNEERLAETALVAIRCGARGIDLNFGCPAPTVNRHDGGATLLKYPDRLESIVSAVRKKVPSEFPVSAKVRLGFDDPEVILNNAKRVENGGASWITVHARTKVNGYQPPAFWEKLNPVVQALRIPVIANGEIWTLEDFQKCATDSGARHFMLGRGALANPFLSSSIREFWKTGIMRDREPTGEEWANFFREFVEISAQSKIFGPYTLKRLKQWMRYITVKKNRPWFEATKRTESIADFLQAYETCLR